MRTYEKARSLTDIRSRGGMARDAIARLAAVRATVLANVPAGRRPVVQRALADLLDPPPSGDAAPRFGLSAHAAAEMERVADDELGRYLFYRYRYEVFPLTHEVDGFPPCLQVEPTSICNYRCVFCYQTDKSFTSPRSGQMGMMRLEIFREIVDQAAGACEAFTLASRGEPLMARDFEAMVSYAAGRFLAFKINTNAWFLDERKAHAILQAAPVTVVFSADAAAEPLYSQLRVNGNLDRVLRNVDQFREIREREYAHAPVTTRVAGVRYVGEQRIDDLESRWGGLVDQVAFVEYNPWENTYERPVNDLAGPCSDLWRRMFVWFDGSVNPCDIDYKSTLSVGSLRDRSLAELWTGEQYASYRAAHLERRRASMSPCNRCTLV